MITNKDLSIDSKNGQVVLNGDKYDLGTQGEIDAAVKDVYSVMGKNGAKNLLVPKWVETQTTENGVTYTFNVDGTIIMNTDESGATADTNCNLKKVQSSTDNIYPAGTYTISGCPSGGTSSTYRTWARVYRPGDQSSPLTDNLYDNGNGVTFTVNETFQLAINLTVKKNYVCNNLTWKPMLRYASDTDNTYRPYAKTNRQLTEVLEELTATTLTGIDISAYNSAANQYTAPTDGYVRFELRNASQYVYLNVNNTIMLGGEGHQVTNANDYICAFIRKGMNIYYTGTVQTAVFYTLT